MTTADIAFAQPGNPDRLRDYEQNARTIFWALLAAILIHLLVAFLLAAFSGFFSPALPAPEKPVELTFMDLSPASTASKNSAFIETDESKKAPEPKDKTFESNANSIGASELAATGELPLPSQAGKDRPLMDFETNPHSLETKGAQPQQNAASQQNAQPAAQPAAPVTAAEQFALLTQKSAAALDAANASSSKRADSDRGKHYQPRDLVGECLGHTARPLPEDRGRFNWLTMVYVRRAETGFDQHRDLAVRVCYRAKRPSEESQSYRKQFERGVRER